MNPWAYGGYPVLGRRERFSFINYFLFKFLGANRLWKFCGKRKKNEMQINFKIKVWKFLSQFERANRLSRLAYRLLTIYRNDLCLCYNDVYRVKPFLHRNQLKCIPCHCSTHRHRLPEFTHKENEWKFRTSWSAIPQVGLQRSPHFNGTLLLSLPTTWTFVHDTNASIHPLTL